MAASKGAATIQYISMSYAHKAPYRLYTCFIDLEPYLDAFNIPFPFLRCKYMEINFYVQTIFYYPKCLLYFEH